ncbi:MAG: diacylglycerol kinase family protein [Bacteroidota bacterium]
MTERSKQFSIKERLSSFKFAINGLRSLIRYEHNSRIHLLAAILVVVTAFVLKVTAVEWLFLIGAIALVFVAELFNSAIENLADFVSPEYQEKIKLVKNYCAAAVLIISIAAAIAGVIIFIPRFLQLLANAQ